VKILVLCPYPEGRAPSQRLKYEQYFDHWRAAGFQVEVHPFWDEGAWAILYRQGHFLQKGVAAIRGIWRRVGDLRRAEGADLVYLHLEAVPLGPPILEGLLRRRRIPLVYDIDDLVHLPHSSRVHPFMRWLRGSEKVPKLIAMACCTVVCTEYLADFARRFSPSVIKISSTIDTDAYLPRPHRDRVRGVVVGWSGSHSTSPYLHLLDDVLRTLQEEEGVRVKVIGDATFEIPGVEVEAREWGRESELRDLSEIDIGVYPLPREEWVLGKSGLKALQYMALEIPTVAERVGANLEIIRHGENGFLPSSPAEWLEVLRRLVRDPDLRRRVGRRGRETVQERYSVRVNAPAYLQVLWSALGVDPECAG